MANHFINLWSAEHQAWGRYPAPADWSFGKCIYTAETILNGYGIEAYFEGDLIGELAAKASISRSQAVFEYERPEWAA